MKTKKKIGLILILASVILITLYILSGKMIYPVKQNEFEIKTPAKPKKDNTVKNVSLTEDKSPDLKNIGKWINTDKELTMEDLKGKVVLIEFWTFGCYNCTNTLPYLKEWYEKYKSENFEMIGVHCPEFDNERNFDNVKNSVAKLGIEYPVLTDNDFSVWKEFDVHAWPTIILVDKNGEIRYTKVGEGKYDITEKMINELLNEN